MKMDEITVPVRVRVTLTTRGILLFTALGFIAGAAFGILIATPPSTPAPDWTVAPCTATQIPKYSIPGFCVSDEGVIVRDLGQESTK